MKREDVSIIEKLRFLTTKKDKIFFVILFFMTIFLSVIEAVGISAIMPFITFASTPSSIFSNPYSAKIYNLFNFQNTRNFMFFFGISLIVFYCFRASYTILYNYLINSFSFKKYFALSRMLFQKILHSTYLCFTSKNTDLLRRNVINDSMQSSMYFRNLLLLCSEFFTAFILYFVLLLINWKMTLVLTCILSLKILLIITNHKTYMPREEP